MNRGYLAQNKRCVLNVAAQNNRAIMPIATASQSEKLQKEDQKLQNTVFRLDYVHFSPLIFLQHMFQVKSQQQEKKKTLKPLFQAVLIIKC